MTGADDFITASLFTAEWLFDHYKKGDFLYNDVYQSLSSRLGYQPQPDHVTHTIASCGFHKVSRRKTGTFDIPGTENAMFEYLSALYGYLATKDQDDPGPLQCTIFEYPNGMRGCYSYDYQAIRPYVLRYLYYNRSPGDLILTSDIEQLRDVMNLTDWIGLERYKLCCARVLNEVGYKKRSNRGRCFDQVRDVTKGIILRHLERCHWELVKGNRPTADQINEHYRKNGIMLRYQQRVKSTKSGN